MIIPPQLLINRFKSTPGAISVCEAIAIYNLAKEVPEGICVDVGSHYGKAAMAAAIGLHGKRRTLHMIDPIYDLTNREAFKHSVQESPENIPWHYVHEEDFNLKVSENIRIVSAGDVVANLIGDYSEKVLPTFHSIGWCFIESDSHQGGMAMRESKIIEDKVVSGGIVAFHDYKNQFSDPAEAHEYLISTGKFENVVIDWDAIFNYVRENNLEEGNQSWHEKGSEEFPKFVGAVKRK
jgi:hypothetical protein